MPSTGPSDPKDDLRCYLQRARESLLWKLDGVSEYDVRRPVVATGTNLLGLIKHLAGVEMGYFGEAFGSPFPGQPDWAGSHAAANCDLWATVEESRQQIIELYRRVWQHSDAVIGRLALTHPGSVPWWPEGRREVTLHRVLAHVVDETARHAGHADIVRELLDGSAGVRADHSNLPDEDAAWWSRYRDRVERAARDAAERWPDEPDVRSDA